MTCTERPLIAIIDDSLPMCQLHARGLELHGAGTRMFLSFGAFEEFIDRDREGSEPIVFDALITDWLEGDGVGVIRTAQQNNIRLIYVISGNIEIGRHLSAFSDITVHDKNGLSSSNILYDEIVTRIKQQTHDEK